MNKSTYDDFITLKLTTFFSLSSSSYSSSLFHSFTDLQTFPQFSSSYRFSSPLATIFCSQLSTPKIPFPQSYLQILGTPQSSRTFLVIFMSSWLIACFKVSPLSDGWFSPPAHPQLSYRSDQIHARSTSSILSSGV